MLSIDNSRGVTTYTVTIPHKLPSLNDYTNACRSNHFAGARVKAQTEELIKPYLSDLPVFTGPVEIAFTWMDANRRRDIDNVAFSKKFILDALVKSGKLPDDRRRYVKGFTDNFDVVDHYEVQVAIRPAQDK